MFGTESSSKRKKAWPCYGPTQAASHLRRVVLEINTWVEGRGVRLSGEFPELKYDDTVQHYDDGTIKRAEDDLLAPGPAHEDDLGSDQEVDAE